MAVLTQEKKAPVAYEEIDGVCYPWAEEETVVQGDWHGWTIVDAMNMVTAAMGNRPDARIYSDVYLYWEEGNPAKRIAPDLFVLPEVDQPGRQRRSVKLWQERSRPIFVLEVLSDSTAHEDLSDKYDFYQDEVGVPEYFTCDPFPLPVRVRGYRLGEDGYAAIERDDAGRVWSEQLQVWFGPGSNGRLRLWNAQGEEILNYAEARQRAEEEARRAEEEARRAEEEARRAEEEARRAEEEARRAESAEARIRELEEQLRRAGRRDT